MKKISIAALFILSSASGLGWAESPTLPADSSASATATSAADAVQSKETTSPAAGECFAECCPPQNRLWFGAEYLMWWLRSSPDPVPFITTFPATSTSAVPGAIGQPDTRILLGGSDLDSNLRYGGRFTAGAWINSERTLGVEANYFFIANHGSSQSVNSGSSAAAPVFVVPFIDALTGKESVGPLEGGPTNSPGATSYAATLSHTNHLGGAELNGIYQVLSRDNLRLNVLAGFRWLQLNENLSLDQSVTGMPGTAATGFAYNAQDIFDTRNNFYGGQLGLRADFTRGRLFANAGAKVALGSNYETVVINGITQTNFFTGPGGAIQTLPGGVFTQPSNIGVRDFERFAVVPEANFNIGYQVGQRTRIFAGYTFLYVSDVARPGNQIDRVINPTQTNFANAAGIPSAGPLAPIFSLRQSDFWAQGINLGLEFRY